MSAGLFEERIGHDVFDVIVLTHSESRLKNLRQAAIQEMDEDRRQYYLYATFDALDAKKFGEDVWLDLTDQHAWILSHDLTERDDPKVPTHKSNLEQRMRHWLRSAGGEQAQYSQISGRAGQADGDDGQTKSAVPYFRSASPYRGGSHCPTPFVSWFQLGGSGSMACEAVVAHPRNEIRVCERAVQARGSRSTDGDHRPGVHLARLQSGLRERWSATLGLGLPDAGGGAEHEDKEQDSAPRPFRHAHAPPNRIPVALVAS
ncbi:MAG: hypothetical protein GEU73_11190 [Chloroflexi bacterium]|nr:hypothetical protein [Chloroflexota bacterium]